MRNAPSTPPLWGVDYGIGSSHSYSKSTSRALLEQVVHESYSGASTPAVSASPTPLPTPALSATPCAAPMAFPMQPEPQPLQLPQSLPEHHAYTSKPPPPIRTASSMSNGGGNNGGGSGLHPRSHIHAADLSLFSGQPSSVGSSCYAETTHASTNERLYAQHAIKLKQLEQKRLDALHDVASMRERSLPLRERAERDPRPFGQHGMLPSPPAYSPTVHLRSGATPGSGGSGCSPAPLSPRGSVASSPHGGSPPSLSSLPLSPRGSVGPCLGPSSPRSPPTSPRPVLARSDTSGVTKAGLSFFRNAAEETPGPGAYTAVIPVKGAASRAHHPSGVAFASGTRRTELPWSGGEGEPPASAALATDAARRKATRAVGPTPGPGSYLIPSSFAEAAGPPSAGSPASPTSAWAKSGSTGRTPERGESLDRLTPSPMHYTPSRAFCSQ